MNGELLLLLPVIIRDKGPGFEVNTAHFLLFPPSCQLPLSYNTKQVLRHHYTNKISKFSANSNSTFFAASQPLSYYTLYNAGLLSGIRYNQQGN